MRRGVLPCLAGLAVPRLQVEHSAGGDDVSEGGGDPAPGALAP